MLFSVTYSFPDSAVFEPGGEGMASIPPAPDPFGPNASRYALKSARHEAFDGVW
jgi:hypothetical protein